MCHINFDFLVKIGLVQDVRDLPRITKPIDDVCKECQISKQARSFQVNDQSSIELLGLVHINLCGPNRVRNIQGDMHFMLLIDDCSRMTWDTFLNKK